MSGAPPLPGLSARPYRSGDLPALTELLNRGLEADDVPWRMSEAEIANWLSTTNEKFDASRDMSMIERDGKLVAYWQVEWVDTTDGQREYRLGCMVAPELRRRGLGGWLLRAAEDHARRREAGSPASVPTIFGAWQPDTALGGRALMAAHGYQPVRYFFEMARPTLEGIVEHPLPEGIELRQVAPEQPGLLRQLWDADVEAFADHWGGFDSSAERFEAWKSDPKFDPTLFVVAWDGDEIAGGSLNEINETENAAFNRKRGWLSSVFVRRPWRRRGLGRAVVARSLVLFRDRGLTSAGLGVDADNPTGALRLYEDAGFEVEYRSTAYRKPME